MSIENKHNFDSAFKVFIAAALAFFGWLGTRTINQFDDIKNTVEEIRVSTEAMKTDIDWLKQDVKTRR